MAQLPQGKAQAPFDEDEDLFHFDELYADKDEPPGEELDLDEFLKTFAENPPPEADATEAPLAEPSAPLDPAPRTKTALATAAAPTTATASAPASAPPRFSRHAWTIVLCLLGGQLLASVLVWLGGQRASDGLELEREALELTAGDLRAEFERRTAEIAELTRPIVSPEPVHSGETFARIERDLASDRFAEARRSLYALLAIVDRLEEPVRTDTEARVRFLLADALRLEADRRADAP